MPTWAMVEAMLTMVPPPPLRIDRATALMPRNWPVTLTLKVGS
ncbi:hypothetical protein [Streptomyces winkii]